VVGEIRPLVGSGGSCKRAGILAATPLSPTCCKTCVRPRCQAMRSVRAPRGTNTAAVARIKEGGGITIGNNHIRAFSKATWGDQLKLAQFG
jgi:hypothetical protein